ncbi:MAG: glycerol-3-phosphate 1-O-acyltransferase PlsY [Burkholderiales bacterium]
MSELLVAIGSYLLGSISFAVIVSRMFALPDPRSYGSNNPGATNVLRTGNKLAAALTLLGDALKGWLAVAMTWGAVPLLGLGEMHIVLAALFVFLGHLFPVFYQFKGGKGVATALGLLLALDWRVGGMGAVLWLVLFALSRTSSVAALVACGATPIVAYYLRGADLRTGVILLVSLLVIWRHKDNIARLLMRRETRIGDSKSSR